MINLLASLLALIILEASLPFYHGIISTVITDHIWNHTPILINLGIFFIAGTFIVSWQVKYMQGADLGINTEYVIGFPMPSVDDEQYETYEASVETFKEALRAHTAIISVGGTSNLPGGDGADINSTTGGIRLVGIADRIEGTTYIQFIDDHFIETVKMELIAGIIGLFYYDFLKLIGISILFGIPAIYYGMNLWLENYAYRIAFPWLAVVLSVFIVIVFAFLAVGYQTYRVAVLNPSQTLKYE
jgi:hypothetical protein